MIWVSIFGVFPFACYCRTPACSGPALSVVIGLILASAFSAILVYAQDLCRGVGTVSGMFMTRPGGTSAV